MKKWCALGTQSVAAVLTLGVPSGAAIAQHVDENAVAQSRDAFGKSVGNEKTGLYTSEEVRGFSPIDAGNARIEGLYFDQVDKLTQRLQSGSTIRVGIAAQHYPFPAPTGIVDYELSKSGEHFEGSANFERSEFGSLRLTLETKIPLDGSRLGVLLGGGLRWQQENYGSMTKQVNYAGSVSWHPSPDATLIAFGGWIDATDEEARPTIYTAGPFLPAKIERRRFLGQEWADKSSVISALGTLLQVPVAAWRLEAGVFESKRSVDKVFSDLLTQVTPDGRAGSRIIVADGNNLDRSISGEVRMVRRWQTGRLTHALTFSLRGRDKLRVFGGTQKLSLGPSTTLSPDPRTEPLFTLGLKNRDQVRQFSYGAAYGLDWTGRGSIDVGIAQSRYHKFVDFSDLTRPDTHSRDNPILWSINASVIASRSLAFYGGYVKGMEEALIAPDIASNRSEAPPAILTRQVEAGVRYAVTRKLSFVGGAFSVRKPYFNLDTASFYRQLGTVENKGIELSLAGELQPGLSIVAGAVLMDPKISGDAVTLGTIGSSPVSSQHLRSNVNIDWRSSRGRGPLSFDLTYEGRGKRTANTANTLFAPPRHSFDLGARYRFGLARTKALLRLQLQNVFNTYGWAVTSSGGFLYSNPRTVTAQLLIDF